MYTPIKSSCPPQYRGAHQSAGTVQFQVWHSSWGTPRDSVYLWVCLWWLRNTPGSEATHKAWDKGPRHSEAEQKKTDTGRLLTSSQGTKLPCTVQSKFPQRPDLKERQYLCMQNELKIKFCPIQENHLVLNDTKFWINQWGNKISAWQNKTRFSKSRSNINIWSVPLSGLFLW